MALEKEIQKTKHQRGWGIFLTLFGGMMTFGGVGFIIIINSIKPIFSHINPEMFIITAIAETIVFFALLLLGLYLIHSTGKKIKELQEINDVLVDKRGALLTGWLIFMLLGVSTAGVVYLLSASIYPPLFPDLVSWEIFLLGFLELLNAALIISMFKWKKWAVYSFLTSWVVIVAINISSEGLGVSALYSIVRGTIIPAITYLLLRSKWKYFE